MKTVIGLFQDRMELNKAISQLDPEDFPNDQVRVLEKPSQVRKYVDCSCRRSVLMNTAGGAAFVGAIFAVIGLVLGVCQSVGGMPTGMCIGVMVVLTALGALVGGILGAIIGWAEVDRDTFLYLDGLRKGHKLMLVRAEENDVAFVTSILEKENAYGVMVCTRAKEISPMQHGANLQPA